MRQNEIVLDVAFHANKSAGTCGIRQTEQILIASSNFVYWTRHDEWGRLWKKKNRGGGPEMLRRHLNFRQISHRFALNFTNPSFQDLNGSHIMYWNMIILNPSRFKVEPHSKYWYFCIKRVDLLSLRFSENAVLLVVVVVDSPCLKRHRVNKKKTRKVKDCGLVDTIGESLSLN